MRDKGELDRVFSGIVDGKWPVCTLLPSPLLLVRRPIHISHETRAHLFLGSDPLHA